VVIDAMDEYQNIDQHQVDKVFEQVADVIRQAASVSIGCKISKGRGTAAWWTQEYAVIRSGHRRRMGSHALKVGIRLGTLCDAAQAEEQRDERLKRALFGMPTRLPHCGGRAWIQGSLAGSKAAARHDRIHARK
jgi:hypothetical protein